MWNLSSLTRDGTYVPCIGRQILNHWINREVLQMSLFFQFQDGDSWGHFDPMPMFGTSHSIRGLGLMAQP